MSDNNLLTVALAQISPVWLNKAETLKKIENAIQEAGKQDCELIAFGEGLVPGYPIGFPIQAQRSGTLRYKKSSTLTTPGMLSELRRGIWMKCATLQKNILSQSISVSSNGPKIAVGTASTVHWFILIRWV